MQRALFAALILSFMAIDWLMFHDLLKPGERFTAVQFMTGAVSVPTMAILVRDLVRAH
jgi:hypothetical protein